MTEQEIREMLEKQLQLLSEQSHSTVAINTGRVDSYTYAMLSLAEFLKNY